MSNSTGIVPVNWLEVRYSPSNLLRLPSHAGMLPENRLELKVSHSKLVRRLISSGIVPVSRFPGMCNCHKAVKLPNSLGICPVKWLSPRDRDPKLVRLPSSAGMIPVNRSPFRSALPSRSNRVTRCGAPFNVTPSQSPTEVSADQFKAAVPLRVSRDASRASQSDTSPGLLAASGTAPSVAQGLGGVAPVVEPVAIPEGGPVPAELMPETR